MIILTNCLTDTADEGGLKVATSLARRIKAADAAVTVISCGPDAAGADRHIPANKLLLNPGLWRALRKDGRDVLYIPSFARMLPAALRIAVLSLVVRGRLRTLLVMKSPIGKLAKLLLKMSKAEIVALSEEAHAHYRAVLGDRAIRLKTGVDTARFVPVDEAKKAALRKQYGIPEDKKVVLHIGHLTAGRNLRQLLKLKDVHIVLVSSSFTLNVKDESLRAELLARDNVTLIETYLPQVEEICQLADLYFFPVTEAYNCIDVPLSALEAAACGKPVVTTAYGEMAVLAEQPGFYLIDSFEEKALNALIRRAAEEGINPREAVLPYDWDCAVDALLHD
ncbi:MAG: glycosyltransferase family 4 protein [Clostridia bacterium]|nr:glycosyltransferase family 4 protein [Clostridia bacterium]